MSDGFATIEFHSRKSRIQSAAPLEEVGEIEPKTASWRAHHGPMTMRNAPSARRPARTLIAWRSSTRVQERVPRRARSTRTRSASQIMPSVPPSSTPSLRVSASTPARKPASTKPRPSPRRPRDAAQSVAGDERHGDRECLGLGHEHGDRAGNGDEDARGPGRVRGAPGIASDRPRERRRQRADQQARERAREGRGTKERDERRLEEARERQPVRVRRDWQRRDIRDARADLGEDPDEVDVQAVDPTRSTAPTST